jgi:hypothetical protein
MALLLELSGLRTHFPAKFFRWMGVALAFRACLVSGSVAWWVWLRPAEITVRSSLSRAPCALYWTALIGGEETTRILLGAGMLQGQSLTSSSQGIFEIPFFSTCFMVGHFTQYGLNPHSISVRRSVWGGGGGVVCLFVWGKREGRVVWWA